MGPDEGTDSCLQESVASSEKDQSTQLTVKLSCKQCRIRDVQCSNGCCVIRMKSRLLVPRREDIRFSDTCLIDSLRALGIRVPYVRNGPFWALRDGGEFLRPQK